MAEESQPSLNFERTRPPRTRSRSSVYVRLIKDFIDSGRPEAAVENVPTKLNSQYMGLRNAVKSLCVEKVVEVTRYTTENTIWLVRIDDMNEG